MFYQYIGQNSHFAINLFASMVFFSVAWLYLDAWSNKKHSRDVFLWLGFLLLSISLLIDSTAIEQSVLGRSIFGDGSQSVSVIIRLAGYLLLIAGQLVDPLQKKPDSAALLQKEFGGSQAKAVAATGTKAFGLVFGLPAMALAIAVLYWRRATKGLEHHLKPVAVAFALMTVSEIADLGRLLRGTTNPSVYSLVKPFGPVWIIEHLALLATAVVLGIWVWKYLVERFFSELFMIFVGAAVAIFLVTTVSFTYLLMNNLRGSALDNLQTASGVLNYAIDSKKAAAKADALALAKDPAIISGIEAKDHKALAAATQTALADNKLTGLRLTNNEAQVLLRAEDPARWGDSASSDTSIRRALVGQVTSQIVTSQGVIAPVVSMQSTVPVYDGSKIVGAISTMVAADNAFLDGIKNQTGLNAAIYSGNTASATTFTLADGQTRQTGIAQKDSGVKQTVLKQGKVFKGGLDILNQPYLAVYSPLKDSDNNVVGMIFIGQPQSDILSAAGRSTQLTFIIAAALIFVSVFPAYAASKHISKQLEG